MHIRKATAQEMLALWGYKELGLSGVKNIDVSLNIGYGKTVREL